MRIARRVSSAFRREGKRQEDGHDARDIAKKTAIGVRQGCTGQGSGGRQVSPRQDGVGNLDVERDE